MNPIWRKSKLWTPLLLLVLFVAGALVSKPAPSLETSTGKVQRRLPVYCVQAEEKKVALTFDCAWENSDTEVLIRLLAENEVKATVFTTGDWCERYPEDAKSFAAAGHDLQNHSYAHPHVAKISREKLREDTKKCEELLTSLTGEKPFLYRAPYGEYDDEMLALLEDELEYRVIQWDVDSRDWQGREASEMVESVASAVTPGSILLFHTDTKNTPAALRQLLPRLKGEGYEFVLVKDLILREGGRIDHTGRQYPE